MNKLFRKRFPKIIFINQYYLLIGFLIIFNIIILYINKIKRANINNLFFYVKLFSSLQKNKNML